MLLTHRHITYSSHCTLPSFFPTHSRSSFSPQSDVCSDAAVPWGPMSCAWMEPIFSFCCDSSFPGSPARPARPVSGARWSPTLLLLTRAMSGVLSYGSQINQRCVINPLRSRQKLHCAHWSQCQHWEGCTSSRTLNPVPSSVMHTKTFTGRTRSLLISWNTDKSHTDKNQNIWKEEWEIKHIACLVQHTGTRCSRQDY